MIAAAWQDRMKPPYGAAVLFQIRLKYLIGVLKSKEVFLKAVYE